MGHDDDAIERLDVQRAAERVGQVLREQLTQKVTQTVGHRELPGVAGRHVDPESTATSIALTRAASICAARAEAGRASPSSVQGESSSASEVATHPFQPWK